MKDHLLYVPLDVMPYKEACALTEQLQAHDVHHRRIITPMKLEGAAGVILGYIVVCTVGGRTTVVRRMKGD